MNDIIDTLKSLVERLENIRQDLEATVRDCRQDLEATVKDCEQLGREIDEMQEAADK